MPSETTINGFHLFQLSAREPSETLTFSEFTNELGDGYDDTLLFGADTGTRTFALDFPVLDMNTASCELDGVPLKPAEYLLELFSRQKVDGTPFVIQSPINNQYYLAKFVDNNLTLKGIFRRLFTGSAMFKQVRISGVSVFDPANITSAWAVYDPADWDALSKILPDATGNNHDLSRIAGGTDYVTGTQNSQPTLKFNSAAGSSYLGITGASATIKEVYMALKVNEATFSDNLGILSGGASDTNGILIGASGTTKFYDLNYDASQAYYFSKNKTEFAESNAQAPMNTWGVVYVRAETGIALTDIFLGKDRSFAKYGKFEMGQTVLATSVLPVTTRRELLQHLLTNYAVI